MTTKYRCRDNVTGKRQILSVTIHRSMDDDPDTSYLGEYSDTPGEFFIDREFTHDKERGEYRYFNGGENYHGESWEDIYTYMYDDYQRAEKMNRGDWHMIGIDAEASIQLGSAVCQTITSGGLWGIESDSDESYLKSVECEELQSLACELKSMGFTKHQIDAAFKKVERIER